jgi:glycosyltransferase 2 family protein
VKLGWKGALGILISAGCLAYIGFTTNWDDAWQQLANANYPLLALSAVMATLMFPIRALKWRAILDPVQKVGFGPLWRSVAIGMMVNNVVGFRAGEPARAYALTREVPSIPFPISLASLAVDRAFDAMVVILLTAIAMFLPGAPVGTTAVVRHGAMVFSIFALGLIAGLYALVFFPDTLIRLFELLARKVSPAVERRGSEVLRSFASGLSILRSPTHFASVFGWTLVHWLVQPVAFWLAFQSVGIAAPWSAALLVQGAIVVGVSVPSTPGYFGPFEIAAGAALPLYGISKTTATTWAVVFHVASFIPITLIGAHYFARLGIKMSDVGAAASAPQ